MNNRVYTRNFIFSPFLQRTSKKFDDWVKKNKISQTIQDELHKHAISTIYDLRALTADNLLELDLNIGDRNRLKIALRKLKIECNRLRENRDTSCNVL